MAAQNIENPQDFVLVGGGLQNALILLALRQYAPDKSVVLIEREPVVGGNHVWSHHPLDVPSAAKDFVEPLVHAAWPGYEVEFPNLSRRLSGGYASITSSNLHNRVTELAEQTPNQLRVLTEATVESVGSEGVVLSNGERIMGRRVIDARGPERTAPEKTGYQKFLGLHVRLKKPGPRTIPMLMDARLPQKNGFRFMYVLPFESDEVLLEDTYFSDGPELDEDLLERGILEYADREEYEIDEIVGRETGVLPMPYKFNFNKPEDSPFTAGYAGGWFHPGTGYSLPAAARVALSVAQHAEAPAEALRSLWQAHQHQARYAAFLNRMLFTAFPPENRWHVFERFYRLPEELIDRFYAMEMTWGDRMRILSGRPPRGMSLKLALSGGPGNEKS
jgi:lycopene beta-cyclase